MRKTTVFLILNLLLLTSNSADLKSFITPYLYSTENYTVDVQLVNISLSSGNYSLVIIRGAHTFLLNTTDGITFVNNTATIKEIIQTYYITVVYPTKTELISINESFNIFQRSRGSEENCEALSGLKYGWSCTCTNNCQSCFSVPACRAIMYGTLTSPDICSSLLVQAIIPFEKDLKIMDTNTSAFYSYIASVNETSDAAALLQSAVANLKAIKNAAEDVLVPPAKNLYDANPANMNAIGLCYPIIYNITAISNTIDKTTSLSSRVPTAAGINNQVSLIMTNTIERAVNKTMREEREGFENYYANITKRYLNVSNRTTLALSYIKDNETEGEFKLLRANWSLIRTLGDKRNYSEANSTAMVFFVLADETEKDAKSMISTYESIIKLNETITNSLLKADFYIEKTDVVRREKLDLLQTKKESVEATVDELPLAPEDATLALSELNQLAEKSEELLVEKSSVRGQQLDSILIGFSRPFIGISLDLINRMTPLDSLQKEKYTNSIIIAGLAIADFILISGPLVIFLYFVHSKKITLHKLAKILWVIIFAFGFLLVILGSIATYNMLSKQSEPKTLDVFMSEVSNAPSIAVIKEITNSTELRNITQCTKEVTASLSSLNKTILNYTFDGESCFKENELKSKVDCLNEISLNPMFIIKQSDQNKATFYLFYLKRAVIEGDGDYLKECAIARALK
jgi:hypothetical protein